MSERSTKSTLNYKLSGLTSPVLKRKILQQLFSSCDTSLKIPSVKKVIILRSYHIPNLNISVPFVLTPLCYDNILQ